MPGTVLGTFSRGRLWHFTFSLLISVGPLAPLVLPMSMKLCQSLTITRALGQHLGP